MTGTASTTGSLKEAKTGPALTGAAGVGGTGEGRTVGVSVGPGTAVEVAVGLGSLVGETSLQAETTNDTINRKLIRQSIFLITIYLLDSILQQNGQIVQPHADLSPGARDFIIQGGGVTIKARF